MITADVLSFVKEARLAGLNVLANENKRPIPASWKKWHTVPQTDAFIDEVFGDGTRQGVGVVCGYGDVECLDFDDADTHAAVFAAASAAGIILIQEIAEGWSERTPSGGGHIIYRCSAVEGNTKLARRPDADDAKAVHTLIETRGVGGQVVVSPSQGNAHPSGLPYIRLAGGPATMVRITPDQRAALFAFLRVFNEMPTKEFDSKKTSTQQDAGDRPGDEFNATFDRQKWNRFLTSRGWPFVYSHGQVDYYRRPGKDDGISASVNWDGKNRFRCFTSSTVLDEGMYSPFAFFTFMDHAGDWKAATKALVAEGFGKQPTKGQFRNESGNSSTASEHVDPVDAPEDAPAPLRTLAPGLGVHDGAFVATREAEEGLRITRLTNFTFRIIRDITKSNGAESSRHYEIEAVHHRGEVRRVTVPAAEFSGLGWVLRELGPEWNVYAGMSTAGKVRQCAQHLTEEDGFEAQHLYQHTGWIERDGEHVFLAANGGLGPNGLITEVGTELPGKLALVEFPEPSDGEALRGDALAYLHFLTLATPAITAPLFALPAAAILGEFRSIDFVPHLYGKTGSFKTEEAALIQRAFGRRFNRMNLPAGWNSTPNALGLMTFLGKNIVLTIDDLKPEGTATEQARARATYHLIARSTGNGVSRGRMNADGTLRQDHYPQGVILSTGEDVPGGHSATGRSLLIEVGPGDIRQSVLTELQKAGDAGAFAHVTSSIISYVARNWDKVRSDYLDLIDQHLVTLRAKPMAHARHAETHALLLSASAFWLSCLVELRAITQQEADDALQVCWEGIDAVGAAQAEVTIDADPCDQFIRMISVAIASGEAHLADPMDNGQPSNCTVLGWRSQMVRVGDHLDPDYRPRGTLIGWADDRGIFLLPESALNVVQTLGRQQSVSIPWAAKTLGKRLGEGGLLLSTERERNTQKIRVAGSMQRVWHIAMSKVVGVMPAPNETQEPIPFDRRKESA